MVFCVIATLMLGKWKAPIDCLGNDMPTLQQRTHQPIIQPELYSKAVIGINGRTSSLYKQCHVDSWATEDLSSCILHVFLVFFGGGCSYHTCVCFHSSSVLCPVVFFRISSDNRHRNCTALQHQQPYPEHVVPPSVTYFEAGLQTYLYSIHIIYNQISKSNQAFHLSCWYVFAFLLWAVTLNPRKWYGLFLAARPDIHAVKPWWERGKSLLS